MAETTSTALPTPDAAVQTHPGVPRTAIEAHALEQNQLKNAPESGADGKEPQAPAPHMPNERIRTIKDHHAKTKF